MTPPFTEKNIKRIAAFIGKTPEQFKSGRLRRERSGDRVWLNKTEPCQFLDLRKICVAFTRFVRPIVPGIPILGKT